MTGGTPEEAPLGGGRFGKYTLLLELGRGGMGVVFEAIDTELNRPVALKMLLTTPTLTPEEAAQDQERFLREARISANLPKHPAIVGVYEAGIINDRRYIAMEYVRGEQMSQWARGASITARQKISLLREVAQAVYHAHRHGVIHRDLKPDNVLVDSTGQPHVMDFGLAKRMTESTANLGLTVQGLIVGTPAYMSPEQAEGRLALDGRTDIYALGVMLFEILAGRVPYQGQSPIQVIMKVIQEPPPSPTRVAESRGLPAADPGLESVCLKAIAKKPADRYASAGEFAEDLGRWLDGGKVAVATPKRPIKKTPGSTGRAVAGPSPNRRTAAWVGGLAAAGLVLGLVGWAIFGGESPPPIDYGPAERLLGQGRSQESFRAFESILSAHPGDARAQSGARKARTRIVEELIREAQRLLAEGKLTDALFAVGQVLAYEPGNDWALEERKKAKQKIESAGTSPPSKPPEVARTRDPERPVPPPQPAKPPDLPPPAPAPTPAPAAPSLRKAATVNPAKLGPGLIGDYFGDRDLGHLALTRVDPQIVFRWTGGPAWPGGPNESFSVRWRGYLRVPKSGSYTIRVTSDDGMRLFVDDDPVLLNWTEHSESSDSVVVALEEGYHDLRLEYFQGVAQSVILLAWAASEEAFEPIPPAFLLHPTADFKPYAATATGLPPSLGAFLAREKDKLRGQTITLAKPGAPEMTAQIKEVGEAGLTLLSRVPGGGTVESRETLESIPPGAVFQMAHRVWPRLDPETLRLVCGWASDRGGLEDAWKEVERSRSDGTDIRESTALLVARERSRIESFKTTAEKSAAYKKLLSLRTSVLDESQRKALKGDLTALEQPARALSPKLQERPNPPGHAGESDCVAFSPDGKVLASGGWDQSLRFWDVATGQSRQVLHQGAPPRRIAFSPDGKLVACSDMNSKVKVFDWVAGSERLTFGDHRAQVVGLAFSPDGSLIASASMDASVRVWEVATGRERAIQPLHPLGAVCVVFSPDGKTIYSGAAGGQIQVWDWAGAGLKGTINAHSRAIWNLSISPDGRSILSAANDGTIRVWELPGFKERIPPLKVTTGEITGGCFSPDGRLILSLSVDGVLKLWDAQTGRELLSVQSHSMAGRFAVFSPTGKMLASSGFEPPVRLFDLSGVGPSRP